MVPSPTVYLWLQPNISSGTVTTVVSGPMSKVFLTAPSPSANLGYNADNGTFYSTDESHAVVVILPRF
jgi:hypothetical protein